MKTIKDTLDRAPAELIVELGSEFPKSVRIRGRLKGQLAIHLLGDPVFDGAFTLSGGEAEVFAIFDQKTRALFVELDELLRAKHGGLRLGDGRFSIRASTPLEQRADRVRAMANELLELLARPLADPGERLLSNLAQDELPIVRNKSLNLLLEKFAGTELSKRAARIALGNFPVQLQLAAATALGGEGLPKLREVLENEMLREDLRRDALVRYLPRCSKADAKEVCWRVIDGPHPSMRLEVAAMLGALADAGTWTRVVLLASRDGDEVVGERIAAGLAHAPVSIAEVALTSIMSRAGHQVTAAAIDALGRAGTIQVVPKLDELARRSSEHKKRARAAIQMIQLRAGSGERGTLSLVGPESGGELSLAKAEQGALTLTGDD